MPKKLNESEIIKLMNEEWEDRVLRFAESLNLTALIPDKKDNGKKKEKTVISAELKLTHKKSGLRYTVDSVGSSDCIIRTPEGTTFIVDAAKLEDEYELS